MYENCKKNKGRLHALQPKITVDLSNLIDENE